MLNHDHQAEKQIEKIQWYSTTLLQGIYVYSDGFKGAKGVVALHPTPQENIKEWMCRTLFLQTVYIAM